MTTHRDPQVMMIEVMKIRAISCQDPCGKQLITEWAGI